MTRPSGPAPEEIGLEEKLRFLRRPESYPSPVPDVTARETHMSWVFLAGDRVYKLKKPVRFPYLDFSTLARRAAACRAECELNRRLAPDVYLGVVPLTLSPEGLAISGSGVVVDHLVVMRRLDDDATLEASLLAGRLAPAQVDRVAEVLRRFYRRVRRIPLRPARHLADWRHSLAYSRQVLTDARFGLPRGRIEWICRVLRRFLALHGDMLRARVRQHRIVDAHGDLRPEHIWLLDRVTIIDCLEFDARLRALDPLDELAFLHLECERLGERWAGDRLRRRLAPMLDEDRAGSLFHFYRAQRALLRARLSIAHLYDAKPRTPEKWPRRARAYLELATADARRLERFL